jgi:hypothetical protein
MNATAITFPSWTAEVQHYAQKAIRYTPIIFKTFNQTIAPILIENIKGFSLHWFESECYWRERITNLIGITHNPLTAAISAARAELTSEDAITTYLRLQHITRETAMDALVICLCGVVAVAQGVEVAQKVYRTAKRVYDWVDVRVNPPQPEPVILPSVHQFFEQSKAQEEIAAIIDEVGHDLSFLKQLDRLDTDALALVCAKVDDAIAQAKAEQPHDRLTEAQAVESPVEGLGQIWNPTPKDMHIEVQQMLQATAAPAMAEANLVGALDVPGATGGKRTSRAKASTSKAGAKPKGTRATTAGAK